MVRTGLAVGGAALVLVGGAVLAWGDGLGAQQWAHASPLQRVESVRVDSGDGQVRIQHRPGAPAEVKQVVHQGWFGGWFNPDATAGEPQHRLRGSTLELTDRCGWNCSVDYEVILPTPVGVEGTLGSGDVTVAGMSSVDMEVGSGGAEISGVDGTVRVRSGSGDLAVSDVEGSVDAETGSGGVDVRDVQGRSVRAHAGSGDVELLGVRGEARRGVGKRQHLGPRPARGGAARGHGLRRGRALVARDR
ncbi:hypothetical protein GIY23_21920 [Allosaccharopolyspora coralli]|uniref:DUF4097 domain-containing protein n=1 Tax=Allosaccharopolyspora coralli TaxID=2665642 RepID=A0A5Q3QEZ7_9PSEU|nr:DUF4097 family beta strand repeat-containing protein [Allosaccharopolyspora coralli]QGK71814.1 hypothetical protein GIY23_21920 [Allosaccharopolyspora coralli]